MRLFGGLIGAFLDPEAARRPNSAELLYSLVKHAAALPPQAEFSGRLYISSEDGSLCLSVPKPLVRGGFQALAALGAEPAGAAKSPVEIPSSPCIVVMRPDEVRQVGGPSAITERGKTFRYRVTGIREYPGEEVSRVWGFSVASPELTRLRRTYGLSGYPSSDGFRIVIGFRKWHVLGDNEVSKSGEDYSGESENDVFVIKRIRPPNPRRPLSRPLRRAQRLLEFLIRFDKSWKAYWRRKQKGKEK